MPATTTTARIEQFFATIRPQLNVHTEPVLSQSIHGWISYYHYLQVIRGGYSPPAMAYMCEHFYPFATTLLDHIADTVCQFFALPRPGVEVSHTRLTRIFPDICTEQELQGDSASLHAAMRELQERIVVHGKTGPVSSTEWFAARWTPAQQEQLVEVLTALDHYIAAMLRFFAQNLERSILRRDPPLQQP
jgi:hypothetical protein